MKKKGSVNPWVVLGVLGAVGYFAWQSTKEARKKNNRQNFQKEQQVHEKEFVKKASFVDEREIVKLYHELAAKYHPDKGESEKDKQFRAELFKKIKKAYDARDIETLKLYKVD